MLTHSESRQRRQRTAALQLWRLLVLERMIREAEEMRSDAGRRMGRSFDNWRHIVRRLIRSISQRHF